MIIATRILFVATSLGEIKIPVRIFQPEADGVDWRCRFEIGWPDGTAERWGAGVDSVQALLSALQMIGAELYASQYRETGALKWLSRGEGFGFPVPANTRDLLEGHDRQFF